MNRISFKYILGFVWMLPLFVQAQVPVLKLSDAMALTLQHNYNIQMAKNDSTSYAVDRYFMDAALLPKFNGTFNRTFSVNAQKQELANGTKRDTSGLRSNNLQAGLTMNWLLFDGMKMFITRDKIQELEKVGGLSVKAQIIQNLATLINQYYGIVRQKQLLKAIEEQISINEERVKLADKKLSVGLGAKPELLQAKVDLNAQQAQRQVQLTAIEQSKLQMNQLMGITDQKIYEVEEIIPIQMDLNYGSITENILQKNARLLLASKNIDIAKLTLKERRAELYPTLSFNSTYNFNKLQNKAVINNFTPLYNQTKGFNYGIGISVPILNGFNTRRQIQQANLDVQYQELNYKNLQSQIDANLNIAYKDYELQKKLLLLEEDNILLAKENVNIALERYKQGVATFLELREAQKSLELAYTRLISARYETKQAETTLMELNGSLLQ